MKWLLAVVLSAGLAFAGGYFWLSTRNDAALAAAKAAHEQALRAERDRLASEIQSPLSSATPVISSLPATVSKNASPSEIIDRLKAMGVGPGDKRHHSLRLVVHLMETLAEQGNGAIPAIKAFLALNEDVDYPAGATETLAAVRYEVITTVSIPTNFLMPPSLRLGLVDVLREIGGPEAQKVLMGVLLTSGRGVEVALAAKALEGMAPSVYRESALLAAKDLLNNPLTVQSPDRLDQNAKAYLYAVFKMYNDTSFAESAKGLLISNGSIDRNALDYLTTVVKDASVPVLMDAYHDPALTNKLDKTTLSSSLLEFVGQNAQVNQMFNDLVTNTNTAPRQRALNVLRLVGIGSGSISPPKDPAQIAAVSGMLSNLNQTTSEPVILKAIMMTLNTLTTGQMLDVNDLNSLRRYDSTTLRTTSARATPGGAGQVYPVADNRQPEAQHAATKPPGPIQVISPGQ